MAISKPMMGRSRGSVGSDTRDDIAYDYRRQIGHYLRELRQRHRMTQLDVAKALGVMHTTVSSFELGRGAPSPEHYDTLADLFGVDRKEMGTFLLRYTNPWLYAMLFDGTKRAVDLKAIPNRI